jgi:membrane-anchored protein YejM (alkaline phosphatase superfamily)
MVGVPIEIVSIGWILTEIFKIIGAKIGEKLTHIKTSTKFISSIVITALWMSVLIINTNIFTIWVFLLNGLVFREIIPNIPHITIQD